MHHTTFRGPQVPEIRCDKCNHLERGSLKADSHGAAQCSACGISAYSSPKVKGKPKYKGPIATGEMLTEAHVPGRHQLKLNPSPRLIGLEIEIDRYDDGAAVDAAVRANHGSNVSDSTAGSGLEINTAPSGGDCYVEDIKNLSKALRAAGAICGAGLGGAGLHCHIDASDMGYDDIRRLTVLYAKLEPAIYSIIAPSRAAYGSNGDRGTHYCKPIGPGVLEALSDPSTAKNDIVDLVCDRKWLESNRGRKPGKSPGGGDRYKGLNLWSWWIRGTIEFRMHQGTTKWQKMIPWGMLLAQLGDRATSLSEKELWEFPAGMKGLMRLAPDTSLQFSELKMADDKAHAWDPSKDGVRQWIKNRWDFFASTRKNKNQPVLPSMST